MGFDMAASRIVVFPWAPLLALAAESLRSYRPSIER